MKKIFNLVIGILLIGCIAFSVILIRENKELKKECDKLSAKVGNLDSMYNSMLQSFTEENTKKQEIESKYNDLENKYNILLADYKKLQATKEKEEIVYEEPGTIEDYDIVTYDTLVANNFDYQGKKICISGTIIGSATDEDGMTLLGIATGDGDSNRVDFIYDSNTIDKDVPINSSVIVYGLYNGLYNDNVPLILGVQIVVN